MSKDHGLAMEIPHPHPPASLQYCVDTDPEQQLLTISAINQRRSITPLRNYMPVVFFLKELQKVDREEFLFAEIMLFVPFKWLVLLFMQ